MLRIGIVAGEASGDLLGAGLIQAILQRVPDAQIEGIAGPHMIAAGCKALYPSEKLAVMGLVEVLGHLRELTGIRKKLLQHFLDNPLDVFIGIDAPDFNLTLEGKLKQAGVRTVHYVSPSVWAWRQWRVKKIARNVDLMLTLFPFEADFYRRSGVPVHFVGHPLADMIPLVPDQSRARKQLELEDGQKLVALLPGSRLSEVERLAPVFLQAAKLSYQQDPSLHFIAPMASERIRTLFEQTCRQFAADVPIQLFDGQSRAIMEASDVILLASGTAALEALLMKRPMLVAYKLSSLTYWILKKFKILKVSRYSLPNLLAGREIVREFIQEDCQAEKLSAALLDLLRHPERVQAQESLFHEIHLSLKKNASQEAATAILDFLGAK